MRKVVPVLGTDCISIVASSISHRRLTIDKPIPSPDSTLGRAATPPTDRLPSAVARAVCAGVVATDEDGGSLVLSRTAASGCAESLGKPGPVSLMYKAHRLGSSGPLSPQVTVMPPARVYFTALSTRFWAIRRILTASRRLSSSPQVTLLPAEVL